MIAVLRVILFQRRHCFLIFRLVFLIILLITCYIWLQNFNFLCFLLRTTLQSRDKIFTWFLDAKEPNPGSITLTCIPRCSWRGCNPLVSWLLLLFAGLFMCCMFLFQNLRLNYDMYFYQIIVFQSFPIYFAFEIQPSLTQCCIEFSRSLIYGLFLCGLTTVPVVLIQLHLELGSMQNLLILFRGR